ncbi:MAG: VanZ family protein [Gammaproteobacteria bacterium]|nr:VanZ family protein [Gammaproteobacteria bacterium]
MALKPMPNAAIVQIWSDKVWHGLAFGALMVWFSGVYPPRQFGRLFLLLLCYGILIETLQAFTPNRHVEAADVLANITGAAAGWVLARAGLAQWCRWLESGLPR